MGRLLRALPVVLLAAALGGCSGRSDAADESAAAEGAASGSPAGADRAKKAKPAPEKAEARATVTATGEAWVPNEHKSGKGRWKDTVAYLDGTPIGVLWFGELPRKLKPLWVESTTEDYEGKPLKVMMRRYRVAEYLEALGVDLKKIKELHIHGGEANYVARITREQLLEFRDTLYFSFGRYRGGKVLLHQPADLHSNTSFDQLAALVLYMDKEPPSITSTDQITLDGALVEGIPYYGDPLRGGIRIYRDDRLVTVIKRRTLEEQSKMATWSADKKSLQWNLFAFLATAGVKGKKPVEGRIIYEEKPVRSYKGAELAGLFFVASPQGRGQIALGEDGQPANAIMLYTTKPVDRPEQVPANAEENSPWRK